MVVLTIVAQKNGETIFFNEPLPKVHFMRLFSCSLYNSWHNLTRVGLMAFKHNNLILAAIPEGHYNVKSFAKELKTSVDFYTEKKYIDLKIEKNNPNSVLKITNLTTITPFEIEVSQNLARLIGTTTTLRYQPTHRGRLRADRSRALCFNTNPYKPYIF